LENERCDVGVKVIGQEWKKMNVQHIVSVQNYLAYIAYLLIILIINKFITNST